MPRQMPSVRSTAGPTACKTGFAANRTGSPFGEPVLFLRSAPLLPPDGAKKRTGSRPPAREYLADGRPTVPLAGAVHPAGTWLADINGHGDGQLGRIEPESQAQVWPDERSVGARRTTSAPTPNGADAPSSSGIVQFPPQGADPFAQVVGRGQDGLPRTDHDEMAVPVRVFGPSQVVQLMIMTPCAVGHADLRHLAGPDIKPRSCQPRRTGSSLPVRLAARTPGLRPRSMRNKQNAQPSSKTIVAVKRSREGTPPDPQRTQHVRGAIINVLPAADIAT